MYVIIAIHRVPSGAFNVQLSLPADPAFEITLFANDDE